MHMYSFIQEHTLIFIVALLVLSSSVLLKSYKVLFIQLLLCFAYVSIDGLNLNGAFLIALFGLQIGFAGFIGYRLKKAVDYNFDLVLEKTHFKKQDLIAGGNPGNQSTFF